MRAAAQAGSSRTAGAKYTLTTRFSEPKWSNKWEFPTLFEGKKAGWLWMNPPWQSQVKSFIRYLQSAPPIGLGLKQVQKPLKWEGEVSFNAAKN